jgi:DNA-binding NarL/FixJ family response regulator
MPSDPTRAAVTAVIVDDSRVFQVSLSRFLASIEGLEIVGCAEDIEGGRRVMAQAHPHLLVLDVELRDGEHGFDLLRHVVRNHPETKVVVLSNLGWPLLRSLYLEAGASAYFDKSLEFERARDWIAACARSAMRGGGNAQGGTDLDLA